MKKHKNVAEQFLFSHLNKEDLDIFQKLKGDKKKEVYNQLLSILKNNGKGGQDYQDIGQGVKKILSKVKRMIQNFKTKRY